MKFFVIGFCLFVLVSARGPKRGKGREVRRNEATSTSVEPEFWEEPSNFTGPSQNTEPRQWSRFPSLQGGGYPNQGGSSGGSGGYPGQGGGSSEEGENEIPKPPPTKPGKPHRPPGCLHDRGQFPTSKSCAHYINCWDDVAVEQKCPGGLLFNDKKHYCDFAHNVHCGHRPKPPQRPSMPSHSKHCPEPNGRYRSAKHCDVFYVCINGNPVKFICPEGLVYSEETQICDLQEKVDCKGLTTPPPPPPFTEEPEHKPTKPTKPPHHHHHHHHEGGGSGGYPGQQEPPSGGYPGQQQPSLGGGSNVEENNLSENSEESSLNPSPPFGPTQPDLPSPINTFPQSGSFAVRGRPTEFWQQRQAQPHGDSQQDLQEQPVQAVSSKQTEESEVQEEEEEISTIAASPSTEENWEVFHTIPQEFAKAPCENGELHRLTDSCSSVVVCVNRRPQLINCQTGHAYDLPSNNCKPFNLAKC